MIIKPSTHFAVLSALCFLFAAIAFAQDKPPEPTLQKAVMDEVKGHVGAGATQHYVWIRGNWAYQIPTNGLDPIRIGDVRYRITRKLYATLDDHLRGIGEGKETSTGWFSVAWVEGEGASGLINTGYYTYVAKGKANRMTVDMIVTGTYQRDGESVPFTWKQQSEGIFFGAGVK